MFIVVILSVSFFSCGGFFFGRSYETPSEQSKTELAIAGCCMGLAGAIVLASWT